MSFITEFYFLHYEVIRDKRFNGGRNLFKRFPYDMSGEKQITVSIPNV